MSDCAGIDESLQDVIGQLEQMQEKLGALSAAIWRDIDHDDPVRLDEGVRFKQGFNECRAALEGTMEQMFAMLRAYPGAGPGQDAREPTAEQPERAAETGAEPVDTGTERPAVGSPVAAALDQKVPFGFVLGGKTYTSASAWPLFYEALLQELYGRAPEKLSRLAEGSGQFALHGKPLFARVADPLDDPLPIADAVFAEADLKPEDLLQVIKRLIGLMGLSLDSFKILLKEKNRGTVETLSIAA